MYLFSSDMVIRFPNIQMLHSDPMFNYTHTRNWMWHMVNLTRKPEDINMSKGKNSHGQPHKSARTVFFHLSVKEVMAWGRNLQEQARLFSFPLYPL